MSRVVIGTGLVCLFVGLALAQELGKKKDDDPLPRKEAIFKLFAEEFVAITPGSEKFPSSFMMGSSDGPSTEQPRCKVDMKYPFAIAKYEVTQELYHVVMGKNPAKWKGPRNSVEMTSWHEAKEFCTKVTAELHKRKLLPDNDEVRLPTEAEWEYCCRAGTTTKYHFGADVKDLTDYCWYKDNSKGYDPPVGKKKANAWGLYDLHGYVWEWVEDDWHLNYQGAPSDGKARRVDGAKQRVARGGGYPTPADQCTATFRAPHDADFQRDDIGFRCVRARKGG